VVTITIKKGVYVQVIR